MGAEQSTLEDIDWFRYDADLYPIRDLKERYVESATAFADINIPGALTSGVSNVTSGKGEA